MTDAPSGSFRDVLRAIPTRPEERPVLRAESLPTHPMVLLRTWLEEEVENGTPVPHAFALATVGMDGAPQARTVILKDLDDALWFATSSGSPKGLALAHEASAEAVFYWARSGRQIRVKGRAEPGPRDVSDADFLARHPSARAGVALGTQGTELGDPDEAERRLAEARRGAEERPGDTSTAWTAYRLIPTHVDVLQLRPASAGERVDYVQDGDGWTVRDLWP
ncbi:oxidase [Labedella populi]|uniref:Oxidase n=1 Tax=Labedella populi TaxID=2498850 RepID=A0A3S4BE89_9MICO|nr:pyridoxamine 5'-phosphate oxidase family protein [Labedella populi]RWZ68643.1 oxidase [Labedella populi]